MNHDTETFNQLMADAEAGRIPWTDAVRIARSEYTDLWVARKRDSMTITAVRRFESGCAAQIRAALRYSDADLDDMERDGVGSTASLDWSVRRSSCAGSPTRTTAPRPCVTRTTSAT